MSMLEKIEKDKAHNIPEKSRTYFYPNYETGIHAFLHVPWFCLHKNHYRKKRLDNLMSMTTLRR